MQLLLLLEPEDLRCLFRQHVNNTVEHCIVQVGIVYRYRFNLTSRLLTKLDRSAQARKRLRAAVNSHDNITLGLSVDADRSRIKILDHQSVCAHPTCDTLTYTPYGAVLDGTQTQSAHDHEVVVTFINVLSNHLPVLTVIHLRFKRHTGSFTTFFRYNQIRITDELESHCDQRVVNLALLLHRFLNQVLLWKRVFHLFEAIVVHSCRVRMTRYNRRIKLSSKGYRHINSTERMLRIVNRYENLLVHEH